MSSTLVQARPTTISTISPDLAVVCMFSLLGLTLSAAVLSYVSSETISMLFSSIGWRCPNGLNRVGGRVSLSRDDMRGAGGMEINQVRYFLALCEEKHFTRAARRCGVSQPSLTNAIKRLEAKLGGSLFHRDRVNTRLTDLGILVRPELVQIDRSATEAKRKAAKFPAARSAKSSQPRAMEAFMRAHHVIAVIVVLVVGFGAKQLFFPPVKAEADINPSVSMNVLQMHHDTNMNNLPVQKIHDMAFVFADGDWSDDTKYWGKRNSQGYDAMKETMAMKIIEQTPSSRNISTDIPATDGGVTVPAVAKAGKGIFARVFDAITESQMKRTEREGRVFLGERSPQSQNRRWSGRSVNSTAVVY